MPSDNYLKPKVSVTKPDQVKRRNGQFVNVDSYPTLGGFTGPNKLKKADPPLAMQKTPSAIKGRPI